MIYIGKTSSRTSKEGLGVYTREKMFITQEIYHFLSDSMQC